MNIFPSLVSYNQLRSTLGVSLVELSDDEVDDSGVDQEVQLELHQWLPTGTTTTSLFQAAYGPGGGSEQATRRVWALGAYSRYLAAARLLITGRLKFGIKMSDAQNEHQRAPWDTEEMIRRLVGQADRYKTILLDELGEEIATAAYFDVAGISVPAYDPVTDT